MKIQLQEAYLDYFNNFLTVARFAECHNITANQAHQLISLGKSIHEDIVEEYKKENDGKEPSPRDLKQFLLG